MAKDKNIIFENKSDLYVKSTTDGLYVFPWRLQHDGYNVTLQDTVVRTSPDAGIPISHSRFSIAGRIIAAKIFVDREQDWWLWYRRATNNGALPCWIYDPKVDGFMHCLISEQPQLSLAGNSIEGVFVSLSLFARASAITAKRFLTENVDPNLVIEGSDTFVYDSEEVAY